MGSSGAIAQPKYMVMKERITVGLPIVRLWRANTFAALCAGMPDKPALDEMVRLRDGRCYVQIWIGEGALEFPRLTAKN